MNRPAKRAWAALLIRLGISALLCLILFLFLITVRIVRGNEMGKAIREGQLILVSRVAGRYSDSVVLYRNQEKEEHLGRIVGFDEQGERFFLLDEKEEQNAVRDEDIIGTVVFAVQYRDF